MIYIYGIDGNMGTRYRTILEYLNIEVQGHDLTDPIYLQNPNLADGFIIATPTNTHIDLIRELLSYNKPILCEKPISLDAKELISLYSENHSVETLLTMVNQYQYMNIGTYGETMYSYFKSGKDGLEWDCINIIGLAKTFPTLRKDSPIWKCIINDSVLDISKMDMAYIKMIQDWTNNFRSNWDYILEAHMKVELYGY